ncbi:hypothetical protein [Nocardia acidivorans]|uniref:hypothetical protein n=1 Tax=Nocardia acidivorans TaxID=404580 RepID=UPI000AA908EB|nr:hypothetical protein [Nocardia acidivorans]
MRTPISTLAPTDFLVDAVVDYLAALSPRDFAAIVAQARPPAELVKPVAVLGVSKEVK